MNLFQNETMTIEGDDWHELRLKNIGGSEVAALFGLKQPYQLSEYALYQVKSGNVIDGFSENERTIWGNRLEEAIANGVAEEKGWEIRKGGYFTDEKVTGMGSTLDYIITNAPEHDGQGVLEIKNVDGIVFKEKWDDGEPPLHILLQLQHQLACSGLKWGYIAALVNGNSLKTFFYEARPDVIEQIRDRITNFWENVHNETPPDVDGDETTTRVINALYNKVVDKAVDIVDNDLAKKCREYLEVQGDIKELEKRKNLLKNQIAEKTAQYKRVNLGNFYVTHSVTPEKPPRPAIEGEIIPGRSEVHRYTIKPVKK